MSRIDGVAHYNDFAAVACRREPARHQDPPAAESTIREQARSYQVALLQNRRQRQANIHCLRSRNLLKYLSDFKPPSSGGFVEKPVSRRKRWNSREVAIPAGWSR
jgi:hypothetical protein